MMLRPAACGALVLALLSPAAAFAQAFPTVPPSLANAAGTICIHVSEEGEVIDAFILTSTGHAGRDRELLAWVRQLQLPSAEDGPPRRDSWSPMPIAFGDAKLPASPKSCAPADKKGAASSP